MVGVHWSTTLGAAAATADSTAEPRATGKLVTASRLLAVLLLLFTLVRLLILLLILLIEDVVGTSDTLKVELVKLEAGTQCGTKYNIEYQYNFSE